ncbi:FMN-linked oxidoreductase [Lactarius hengduanensis]|nr:FMN-linked oxidoreductase [Lactarius hengduanensis]
MSNRHDSSQSALRPVTLPSGQVMPNALVKAAMYEHMASLFGGLPNANHFALYSLWSQGGWGMIMTGNVQVSQDHLTLGRDMVVPKTVTSDALRSYAALASAMRPASEQDNQEGHDVSKPRTLIIMQLSHAGRQSPIVLGGRLPLTPPFAPSALRIGRNEHSSPHLSWFARLVYKIGFQTPRAMSVQDIDHVVDRFVLSAKLAHDAGFDGVELHASHGYLLAQFISPKSNIRDDAYGARHAPLHLLQRIVSSIRKVLPRPFVLGIKLSSSDYVGAGSLYNAQAEEEAKNRALAHIVDIARWDMVDFIEISGGDYENPEFMTSSRQAFFARFARKARDAIHAQASSSPRHPLVLLTGGMRSPEVFEDALSQGHADLVGIGRASVLAPRLPLLLRKLYSGRAAGDLDGGSDEVAREFSFQQPTLSYSDTPLIRAAVSILRWLGILPLPTLIGAGAAIAWYVVTMSRTSRGSGINYQMGGIRVILTMWIPELRAIAPLFSCCLAICFYSRFQWW